LPDLLGAAAGLRQQTPEALAAQVRDNAMRLFRRMLP
jgi:hypothetical protein